MHTDWYDANVTSPVVSDKAVQKNDETGNHIMSLYNEPPAKRISESKINNTTQGKGKKLPFINPGEIKTLQQKEKKEGKVKERKKKLPSSSLSFICNLSPSSSTES